MAAVQVFPGLQVICVFGPPGKRLRCFRNFFPQAVRLSLPDGRQSLPSLFQEMIPIENHPPEGENPTFRRMMVQGACSLERDLSWDKRILSQRPETDNIFSLSRKEKRLSFPPSFQSFNRFLYLTPCSLSHCAFACSTFRLYRITIITTKTMSGNHRYMKFSMLMADCGCCAAFGT